MAAKNKKTQMKKSELRQPAIFMCSGYQTKSLTDFCNKKGVDEFLEKPIQRE